MKHKRVKCPDCSGFGWKMMQNYDGTATCKTCKGRKTIPQEMADLIAIRDDVITRIRKVKL